MIRTIQTCFITAAFFVGQTLYAATYIPISFYKQAEESHGAIHAIYLGSVGKKLKNNEIVTEASFKVLKSTGLKHNEIKNKDSFKILYPGGVWEGIGSYVSGAPSFTPDEEVVLLVKKTKHGYIMNGLALGKYSFITAEDGKKYLSSSVFPEHKELGKVDYQEANSIFRTLYGETLTEVSTDKFVHTNRNEARSRHHDRTRAPASVAVDEEESSGGRWGIFWLVMLFTAMGCVTTVTIRREKNK
jgi:hypothetical protein